MAAYDYHNWTLELERLQNKLRNSRSTLSDEEFEQLQADIENAKKKQEEFYPDYMFEVYRNCGHISGVSYEHIGGGYDRSRTYVKCVKCGLDDSVLSGHAGFDIPEYSQKDEKIMWDYLYKIAEPYFGPGIFTGVKIIDKDYQEIKDLYDQMIKQDPDLTDYKFLKACEEKIGLDSFYAEDYIRVQKIHGNIIDKETGKVRTRTDEETK